MKRWYRRDMRSLRAYMGTNLESLVSFLPVMILDLACRVVYQILQRLGFALYTDFRLVQIELAMEISF